MIFPDVRISELKADLELKRREFDQSASGLKSSFAEYAQPINFFKKNPWAVLGSITSAMVAFKAATGLIKRRGWIGKLVSFVGVMLAKNVLPLATQSILAGLNAVYNKKKRRS